VDVLHAHPLFLLHFNPNNNEKKREAKAQKPSEMGLHSKTRYVIHLQGMDPQTFGKGCRPVGIKDHRGVATHKRLDTYDNGRQWKRICKTSGNSGEIGNFFLFLYTVSFLGTWSQ